MPRAPVSEVGLVAMQGAGHRDSYVRRDEQGNTQFRDDPIVDVKGKPILNSAGQALDIVMPAHRSVSFYGDSQHYALLAGIAKRAGRALARLSESPVLSLLDGWRFSTQSDIWWGLLFELAWADCHPLLVAEKRLWLPSDDAHKFVPYDLQQLRGLASSGFALFGKDIPENWLKRLPEAWLSEIDDVLAASSDAMDYVLSELTTGVGENDKRADASSRQLEQATGEIAEMRVQRRFAVALSFPGEHRVFVGKVASALRSAFGEQRVFYDRFHEGELSRPNLDLALQQIYGDESDLVVVFVCGEYVEKEWCGVEWRTVRSVMKSKARQDEDVMFLRFDDKPLEGHLPIDGFMDISKKTPRAVADSIIRRWSATR